MRRLLLIALILLFGLTACDSGEEPVPPTRVPTIAPPTETPLPSETPTLTPPPTATVPPIPIPETTAINLANQGFIRVIQGSTTLEPVDVYIDGLAVAFGLNYADFTAPSGLVAGEYTVRVLPSGARLTPDAAPILESVVQITGGRTNNITISGLPGAYTIAAFPEFNDPLAADTSRVSLIHGLADGPSLTIRQGVEEFTTPVDTNTQTIPVDIPAGAVSLEFVPPGGTEDLETYIGTLEPRNTYTFALIGNANVPETITLLEFRDRVPGQARLRTINITQDVGGLDVYLNQELIFPNVEPTRDSGRLTLPTGQMIVEILPTGADYATTAPLDSSQFNLNEDDNTTLIISGLPEDVDLIRLEDDLTPTAPDTVRMTFVHTLPGAPEAQVNLGTGPLQDVDTLQYTQASDPVVLGASVDRLVWLDSAGIEDLETAQDFELDAGQAYLYLLTGRDVETPPIIFGDEVGIDETLSLDFDIETTPTPEPEIPAQVRIVNMLESRQPINVYLDDIPLAIELIHAQPTETIIIPANPASIIIQQINAPATPTPDSAGEIGSRVLPGELANATEDFRTNTLYTVYIYGSDYNDTDILITVDRTFDASSGIRLVNLTNSAETRFGLAVNNADLPVAIPSPDPTSEANIPEGRQLPPTGYQALVSNILTATTSDRRRLTPGTYDIFVTDSERNLLAKAEFDRVLEADAAYDVIVQQIEGSLAVNLFIVRYP